MGSRSLLSSFSKLFMSYRRLRNAPPTPVALPILSVALQYLACFVTPGLAIMYLVHQARASVQARLVQLHVTSSAPGTVSLGEFLARQQEYVQRYRTDVRERMRYEYPFGLWICPHCGARGASRSLLDYHMVVHLAKDGLRGEDLGRRGLSMARLKALGRLGGGNGPGDKLAEIEARLRRLEQRTKALPQRALAAYARIAHNDFVE